MGGFGWANGFGLILPPLALIPLVGKFRPQLIKVTSFKPKLLIRSIMNKPCSNKQISISSQNHA